ncbi:translation initiation factor IF-2 [Adhaeribacter pallidiroseus]|uniref:Translation initiation factor IF-2 n=1 Tax=Adhaeribacter pallidiroseus TaxID=2072847 RepID=A0A369QNJ2_9BACT|nr:translation initiation factor IF-2 [Adhaeribacter pallidiroseus]RDC65255.1 Translation initiation factor IF-2 [Adhaeribacter pallidiroseus]
MAEEKTMRLKQVATTLNISTSTVVDFLAAKGFDIENKPTSKITSKQFEVLMSAFESSVQAKIEAEKLNIGKKPAAAVLPEVPVQPKKPEIVNIPSETNNIPKPAPVSPVVSQTNTVTEQPSVETGVKLPGIKVVGKIDLNAPRISVTKPVDVPQEPESFTEEPLIQAAKEENPEVTTPESPTPVAEERQPEPIIVPEPEVVAPQPTTLPEPVTAIVDNLAEEVQPPEKQPEPEPLVAATPSAPVPAPVVNEVPEVTPANNSVAPEARELTDADADEPEVIIPGKADPLKGLTVLGKIELPKDFPRKKGGKPVPETRNRPANVPVAGNQNQPAPANAGGGNANNNNSNNKKKRKRIIVQNNAAAPDTSDRPVVTRGERKDFSQPRSNQPGNNNRPNNRPGGPGAGQNNRPPMAGGPKPEVSDKQIQDQIKATLARLSGNKNTQTNRAKYRREKRSAIADATEERRQQEQSDAKILKLTEFISANDLASLMNVSVNDVIKVCMALGMFVSINQRLDAEAITIISDEFGYDVEFLSAEDEEVVVEEEEDADALADRAPIVTIMGHVDHGKTSLLDYIRSSKVTAGEAGGITQHIGAYDVLTDTGKRITFLDTPGHEAFTAMRARGAKITDVVIIVVAADDDVMPQTKEALNHAQAAGVPIVIAINKIDKPSANPERIREQLAAINVLVEDWGGKYQCQEISAKSGVGIPDLLEKVLLEAELLELKANPDRNAVGAIIEASLDKGRGYVTTVLVQTGSLHVGDVMLAGSHFGRVRAMTDHRGKKMKVAGPSTPVQVLGLDGAPQAGDKFVVYDTEREAREIASSRQQLQREQSLRTKKHITLDEIGRRLAIGSFKELNVIVKGDVDGSVEALSDSLLKLSTNEVQVNILNKGVGQISESDVLLASASDAIIIGFQVRPSANARKLAEQEQIDIRLYSIIYNAINELKDAMEGMLAPTMQEVVMANVEVREVFRITKVGTIAGCMVTDGTITRNSRVRLVRDGIVVFSGEILALKRFKDDVAEVRQGYECGISIKNFNDIEQGDIIEAYEEREVKRTL